MARALCQAAMAVGAGQVVHGVLRGLDALGDDLRVDVVGQRVVQVRLTPRATRLEQQLLLELHASWGRGRRECTWRMCRCVSAKRGPSFGDIGDGQVNTPMLAALEALSARDDDQVGRHGHANPNTANTPPRRFELHQR